MAIFNPVTDTGKTRGQPISWPQEIAAAGGPIVYVNNTTELNAAAATGTDPGKVILLRNGGNWSGDWNLNISGIAGQPVIICAENPGGWGVRNVTKDGSKVNVRGNFILSGAIRYAWNSSPQSNAFNILGTDIRLTDFEFQDIPLSGSSRAIVIDDDADRLRLDHNRLLRVNGYALVYDPDGPNGDFAQDVIVEYNEFDSCPGGEFFQVGALPNPYQENEGVLNTGVIFRYNRVMNCNASQLKTSSNQIYRNYFSDMTSNAVVLRAGNNNILFANYFKNCPIGVRVFGGYQQIIHNIFDGPANEAHVTVLEGSLLSQMEAGAGFICNASHVRPEHILIARNLFLNPLSRAVYIGRTQVGKRSSTTLCGPIEAAHYQPYSPLYVSVMNNLAVMNAGVAFALRDPTSSPHPSDNYPTNVSGYHQYVGLKLKGNVTHLTGSAVLGDQAGSGRIAWNHSTKTSGSEISNNTAADPALFDTFRHGAGSPAIDAGVAFDLVGYNTATAVDIDGNPASVGATPDSGVMEYQGVAAASTGHVGTTDYQPNYFVIHNRTNRAQRFLWISIGY